MIAYTYGGGKMQQIWSLFQDVHASGFCFCQSDLYLSRSKCKKTVFGRTNNIYHRIIADTGTGTMESGMSGVFYTLSFRATTLEDEDMPDHLLFCLRVKT